MLNNTSIHLDPSLFDEIDAHLRPIRDRLGKGCLSEHSFPNLYLFRNVHAYRYRRGTHPIISGTTYDGVRHALPLFDPRDVGSDVLTDIIGEQGCLFPIPADVVAQLDSKLFFWADERADADYLYHADNFRMFRGQSLRKKKLSMRQLLGRHHVEAQSLTPSRRADANDVLDQWMADKGKAAGQADERACREAILLAQDFGFDGFVFYVEGRPIGLLIVQRFTPTVAVVRFAKGVQSHNGIYPYMFHWYCIKPGQAVEWLNFEQDLGLENFRQTKRSYQPTELLAKFRVWVRR